MNVEFIKCVLAYEKVHFSLKHNYILFSITLLFLVFGARILLFNMSLQPVSLVGLIFL